MSRTARPAQTPEARTEQARQAGLVAQGIDTLVRRVVRRRDELRPHHLTLLRALVEGAPVAAQEDIEMYRVLLGRRS